MRCIEEYKHLEDDWMQSKGKAPVVNFPRQSGFQPRSQKDLRIQELELQLGEVNVTFKEPVHRIVDQIKNESYFKWPNKMRETHPEETRTCIVLITEIKGTPLSNAEY